MRNKYLFLIILCGMFFVLSACSKSINLMDYSTVEISGYDSKGVATIKTNWSSFENDILANSKDSTSAKLEKFSALTYGIKYTIDKDKDLKNGDIVTLNVAFDKDLARKYGYSFKGEPKKITVTDLKQLTEIDVFQDVHIEYDGVSPNAKAIIRNASNDSFIKSVTFNIENYTKISNGQEFKVIANISEQSALNQGYVITAKEKMFTASGIDEYIKKFDTIDSKTLDKLKLDSTNLIESTLADNYKYYNAIYSEYKSGVKFDGLQIESINLKNSYFLSLKDGLNIGYDKLQNYLFLLFEIKFKTNISTETETSYLPVRFQDLIKRSDGTIDIDASKAKLINTKRDKSEDAYREIVTKNKAEYDIEEKSY